MRRLSALAAYQATYLACALALSNASRAGDILLAEIRPAPAAAATPSYPDQLPQSHAAHGTRDIAAAWLAQPTARYDHGVLGDGLEAARLVVETRTGKRLHLDLPEQRVFEDLHPRLADLDHDGRDEIIVVESDANEGAALAVYGIAGDRIALRARTPFIGRAYRWLNPVGAGDFDGDGRLDLALVATPHIGGVLRLYRYSPPELRLFAESDGVSTHRMGSTELGLGQVVPGHAAPGKPHDRLLLPDQTQHALLLIEWTPAGLREIARAPLPARLRSSLAPAGDRRWHFELDDGRHFEARITD